MVDNPTDTTVGGTDAKADFSRAGSRLDDERKALSETMGKARDTVAAQTRDLKDQAADRVGAEAETIKDEAAAGLSAFSDALKAASGELSGKQLGFAGDVVQQAADGLAGFARAIEGRSPGEMLEGIRSFGRQNPAGFIAGSVLAGIALGRLAAVIPDREGTAPTARPSDFGTTQRTVPGTGVPGTGEPGHVSSSGQAGTGGFGQ
jgi:hypothetical protein